MIEHISNLLSEHDCVILPGLGGIVTQYEPARKDLSSGLIYPPSKSLAFNAALQKNDGLLQNHIAQQKGISFREANNEVEYFVNEVKNSLKSKNTYVMNGIGRFVMSEDQLIQFFPSGENNFNLASYGLPQLNLVPVNRLKKTTPVSVGTIATVHNRETEQGRVLVKSNSFSKTYFRVAATVGALFLLTTLIYHSYIIQKESNIQEASFVTPVKSPAEKEMIEQIVEEVEEDTVIENVAEKAPIKNIAEEAKPVTTKVVEKPATTSVKDGTLRIIVGSFGEPSNAIKYAAELNARGYKSEVLPGPSGFSRVCIYEEAARNYEYVVVQKIRDSVNPNAWLLD